MPKVIACIIARTVSKRLPLKVLRDFSPNLSMIDFLIERIKQQKIFDSIYLCTSQEPVDDIMEDIATRNNINIYRGSSDAVIERMLSVGAIENADILVRITGDNPFTAIELVEKQVELITENSLDYIRVIDLPIGGTAEVFTREALVKCNLLMDPDISEYLMLFLFEPDNFKCGIIRAFKDDDLSSFSLTVDTDDDLTRSKIILRELDFTGDTSQIDFFKVISIIKDKEVVLPARIVTPSGTVKLPYDKTISYEEFKADMLRRVERSVKFNLYD